MTGHLTRPAALHRTRRLAHDLERDLRDALGRAPRLDPAVARPLEHALEHACDLHLAFTRALDIAIERALARALIHALDRSIRLARAHGVDLGLDDSLARARALARVLTAPGSDTFGLGPPGTAAPRIAEWLIAAESRLLPEQHRSRFFHEFRSELHELACEHDARWPQVMYTLRQFRRVAQLRAAIQAPARPRLYRTHTAMCWVLASNGRTWGLLGPVMAFAIVNVHLQQGWGSALFTIPGVVAFNCGVEWLRKRWAIDVKRRRRPGAHTERE
ncbi:hypothetical protein [Nonomuraea sp. NPDC002799]